MTKLEQGQIFRTLSKVNSLSENEDWLVYDVIELKKMKYYKLSLANAQAYRCIAIITFDEFDEALNRGKIQLLNKKKIKKKKEAVE